jgi:hypothetical protein
MSVPVTLHVRTEPYEDESIDGNKVIGEVKRGDEVLHTKEVITNDCVHSVCSVKDDVALDIELWAVQHTDFMPTADAMPA